MPRPLPACYPCSPDAVCAHVQHMVLAVLEFAKNVGMVIFFFGMPIRSAWIDATIALAFIDNILILVRSPSCGLGRMPPVAHHHEWPALCCSSCATGVTVTRVRSCWVCSRWAAISRSSCGPH